MFIDEKILPAEDISDGNRLKQYKVLKAEADTIRKNDKSVMLNLFRSFYNKKLNVGIGFQRAYGAVLAGDYFELVKLPDGNYLFVFLDISGHGLPAYTTLIRLRSAITLAVNDLTQISKPDDSIDTNALVADISTKFTDIMDASNIDDFACVNFTFIYYEDNFFTLKFYNRSMLFPIVVRKNYNGAEIFNLNLEAREWIPEKGYLLGSDLRQLLGESYLDSPCCEFKLYEGDSILYYSDGIIEAYNNELKGEEFGDHRIEQILLDNIGLGSQEIINKLFAEVYSYIGKPEYQKDDMTAVLIDFPLIK